MVRIVPSNGAVIYPYDDVNALSTIKMGLWSKDIGVGSDNCPYKLEITAADGSNFRSQCLRCFRVRS